MHPIRAFINRPVTTVMLVSVFVVLGVIAYQRLNMDLFPEIDFPLVMITLVYEGAAPEEIETQLVKKVEDAVASISDIKHMESYVHEHYALVFIEFSFGVDVDIKALEIKDKVEAIAQDLPEDADRPLIEQFDPFDEPTLSVALFSDSLPLSEIYALADGRLKDAFGRVTGVARVDVVGGRERQINVRIAPVALMNYRISILDVIAAIKNANLDVPAGTLDRGMLEIGVRLKGQFEGVEEIRNLRIAIEDVGIIRLRDVATVEDAFKDITSQARFMGEEAVILEIFKQSDANVVATADGVYRALEQIRGSLPEGLHMVLATDESTFIRDSVGDALTSIVLGVLLTTAVLFLFLGDIRVALVAAVVIPTSLISSFIVMQALGFTINIITLMALGVSIGALVANAIVIIENIYSHVQVHEDPREGAARGTAEVLVAVLAAAGTNIVVFIPIAFMKGVFGQVFYPFGLTVVAATAFSLLASFSLTPMLAAYALRRGGSSGFGIIGPHLRFFARAIGALKAEYLRLLRICLSFRGLTLLVTLATVLGAVFLARYVGGEPFPTSDSSEITIEAELSQDAALHAATLTLDRIEERVRAIPELRDYSSTIGGENKGLSDVTVRVRLGDLEQRSRSDQAIAEGLIAPLCTIPDMDFSVSAGRSSGHEGDMNIELYGPDYDELVNLSYAVKDIMDATGNFQSIISSYKPPRKELRFVPDGYKTSAYGGNNALLGTVLRASIEGVVPSVLREGGEEYDIHVALSDRYTTALTPLGALLVPLGKEMELNPITQVGTFLPAVAESKIERKDKERKITLTAYIGRRTLTENIAILEKQFTGLELKEGYRIEFAGDVEINREARASTSEAFIIASILTFMLLAAILNSFVHPFTILLSVPLGLAGVLYALFFSGITLNMMSMMSIVMLVGIVVNSAILIIDQAMAATAAGEEAVAAVTQACADKFRPILMTNIAIICGLLPQAFGGSGASFRSALALPTIGGIILSTFFTMFFIPVVFVLVERLRARSRNG